MNQESIQLNSSIFGKNNIELLRNDDEASESWQNAIYQFLKNWYDDTEYVIAHTSGSTGKPKEILLAKNAMRNSARMTNTFFGLDESKTALLCLPANYIAGKMMLVRAIVGGFNLITVEPKANPFEQLNQTIDFTAITPFQLNFSAESLKNTSIQNIIVGGGHVNSRLEEVAIEIPAALYETYGMTETCSHIALRRFNGEKSDYFTVLEGISIGQDKRSCLVIKAPHLINKELITNDIVELKGEKSFKWQGRADSVINSGGVKIHPEQVEKKLEGIIHTNYFIASIPDVLLENKVVLVLENLVFNQTDIDNLKIILTQVLEKYEMPKEILYRKKFIFTLGNKLLRTESLNSVV